MLGGGGGKKGSPGVVGLNYPTRVVETLRFDPALRELLWRHRSTPLRTLGDNVVCAGCEGTPGAINMVEGGRLEAGRL